MANQLDHQHNDEILNLEIAYSTLYRAYIFGNRTEMINAIMSVSLDDPYHIASLQNGINRIFTEKYGSRWCETPNWDLISDTDIKLNVEGLLNALSNDLSKLNIYQTNYTYAQSVLFQPYRTFERNDIIYIHKDGKQLTVADFLAVSKYAIRIAEAIDPCDKNFAMARAAIGTLQGIIAILNNTPENKPVNKLLHLVSKFISSVVKSSLKNEDAEQDVSITSTMIDLAIDFLIKE